MIGKTRLKEVFIETTTQCNLRCTFCPYPQITRRKENMPLDRVIRLVDDIDEHFSMDRISFHLYGEPLMHPQFRDIITYAAIIRKLNVSVTTNGILLTPSLLKAIMAAGVRTIILSIQAPPELFNLRGSRRIGADEYQQHITELVHHFAGFVADHPGVTMELHYLDTSKFKPGSSLIVGPDDFIRILDYWFHELTRRGIHTLDREQLSPAADEETGILYELAPGLKLRLKPAISFGNAISSPDVPAEEASLRCSTGFCAFPVDTMTILANGDMVSCCLDHNGENVWGNVFETGSVKEVFYGRNARQFRDQFIDGFITSDRCQTCLGGVFYGSPI